MNMHIIMLMYRLSNMQKQNIESVIMDTCSGVHKDVD